MMTPCPEVLGTPPLGLYVHMPWCVSKCPYCDFNSHPLRGALPADAYIASLLKNLEEDLPAVAGREVASVYFGGGTPSLFSGSQIGALLEGFAARLNFSAGAEITLEANPGTIERDSFRAYRDAGVNRVSLGVQSFQDHSLQRLGRIHDRQAAEQALASLARAGLDNFNIDLMFGLPEQTLEQALDDLQRALAFGPAHLSHYQLTLEPNTAFAAAPPDLPDEDACWEMQEACARRLEDSGFEQYEISAWSRPGRQCAHNLNYWRYGDFLGLGAGAHAKLTNVAGAAVVRWSRPRHPRASLSGAPVTDRRPVAPDERVFEFFLNRLRLQEGFTASDFMGSTGLPWEQAAERVNSAIGRGLLAENQGRYRPTALGWRFVNDIQSIFLP
jgi:oxygen-independent coproporphyrinogen-3 oxidase